MDVRFTASSPKAFLKKISEWCLRKEIGESVTIFSEDTKITCYVHAGFHGTTYKIFQKGHKIKKSVIKRWIYPIPNHLVRVHLFRFLLNPFSYRLNLYIHIPFFLNKKPVKVTLQIDRLLSERHLKNPLSLLSSSIVLLKEL